MLSKSLTLKATLALSLFALSTNSAHAAMGFKGGFGMSKYSRGTEAIPDFDLGADSSTKMGYLVGFSFDSDMGPVGLMVDALYAKRAFGDNGGYVGYGSLHVPVQVKLSILPILFVSGGIYMSYALTDLTSYNADGDKTASASFAASGFKKLDYGAVAGVGVAIPTGAMTLSAELRYNLGLVNVIDTSTDGVSLRLRHIDFLVGVMF